MWPERAEITEMEYYKVMKERESGIKSSEFNKRHFIVEVLAVRGLAKLNPDDEIVTKIKDRIGTAWEDTPMPVAAIDLPELVEDYFRDLTN